MSHLRLFFFCALSGLTAVVALRAETMPPKPAHYFNDYAHIVSPQQANALDQRLQAFERETSNQIVVAIFPRMNSESSVEDYTVRIAQSWGVGQKGRNNGAVLFCFMAEHKLYIQVGYGLEGALPDATCHAIIENELKPSFRSGNFAGGLDAATAAMIAATKGEYRGTGRTRGDTSVKGNGGLVFGMFILVVILASLFNRRRQNTIYGRGGSVLSNTGFWGGGSGGGWSGGGGGGFSGGGGSFGGGGSGGSW